MWWLQWRALCCCAAAAVDEMMRWHSIAHGARPPACLPMLAAFSQEHHSGRWRKLESAHVLGRWRKLESAHVLGALA